jgi:hypothetical protein
MDVAFPNERELPGTRNWPEHDRNRTSKENTNDVEDLGFLRRYANELSIRLSTSTYEIPIPDDLLYAIKEFNLPRWCAFHVFEIIRVEGVFRLGALPFKTSLASSAVPAGCIRSIRTPIGNQYAPDLVNVRGICFF